MKTFLLFLSAFLMAGCRSEYLCRPIQQFRSQNPNEYRKYIYIYPISLDTYYYLQGQQMVVVDRVVREIQNKYGITQGVDEYVKEMLKRKFKENDKFFAVEDYRALEKVAEGGGVICQFKWDDGQVDEIGMLVLKNGLVVERDVWVTEYYSARTNELNSTRQP